MAAKKTKETKPSGDSDEEFLSKIMKSKEEATKKISSEIDSYSEAGEFREKGKVIAKDLEEHEECKKIVEEFKRNPPVYESVTYNGVSFSFVCNDSRVQRSLELLKKHGFGFIHALKSISNVTINFKSFGSAYIKRGGLKIPLPGSSQPEIVPDSNMGMGGGVAKDPKNLNFLIKDGDILGTERNSYIYEIKDAKEDSENVSNDIMIFPESELRITIRTETEHPEPEYMVPGEMPLAIKSASSNTDNTDIIEKIELVKGLFQVRLLRKGKDINKVISISSNYPQVEFGPASAMAAKYFNEMSKKAEKTSPKIANLIALVSSRATEATRMRSGEKCDEMAAFIELVDGSVVLFGTPNNIIHRGIGKETQKMDPRKKITLTASALYETDCSKGQDPRVEAIMKAPMAIITYNSLLLTKKIDENEIIPSNEKLAENDKKMREENEKMLKNAEDLGDDEAVEMLKMSMRGFEDYIRRDRPKEMEELRANVIESKKMYDKMYAESKRQAETPLPPSYNAPSEKDKV